MNRFKANCAISIISKMINLGQVSCTVEEFLSQLTLKTGIAPGAAISNPRWALDRLTKEGFVREHRDRIILTDKILQNPGWEQEFVEACD